MVSIKSYSYNKLVLAYGPNQGATVTVQWSTNDKAFKLVFGRSKFSALIFNFERLISENCVTTRVLYP